VRNGNGRDETANVTAENWKRKRGPRKRENVLLYEIARETAYTVLEKTRATVRTKRELHDVREVEFDALFIIRLRELSLPGWFYRRRSRSMTAIARDGNESK